MWSIVFIVTARFPRRRMLLLTVLLLAAVLLFILLGRRVGDDPALPRAADNGERVAYLTALGWNVDPEPLEVLELRLPEPLAEPYLSYNALQLQQGFDLAPYCGKTLTRCTYAVKNYPGRAEDCQADLFLCGAQIVAGDIVCTGADGFLAPLAFPNG